MYLFILLFISFSHLLIGQSSVKDFFIPKENNNLSNFSTKLWDVQIWYIPISDTNYKIVEANFYQGKLINKRTSYITITEKEIKVTKVEFGTDNVINYNPSTIWVKMPENSNTSKFEYKNNAEVNECTAEWTEVIIDGQKKKAIKIKYQAVIDGQLYEGWNYKYYVEGIGLWKTELSNGTTSMEFINQQYDATIK